MKIEGGNQWQGKSVNSNEVIDLLADDLMSEVILFSTQVAKNNISIQLHTG